MKLGKNVFLALAAVGVADGAASANELEALIHAAGGGMTSVRASVHFAALVALVAACDRESPPPASPVPSTASSASAPAPLLAIVGGTVIHPARDGEAAVEKGATVIVRGDRVV